MKTVTRIFAALAVGASLAACGGGSGGSDAAPPVTQAQLGLLFYGNSHTEGNDLPAMVEALVRTVRPGKTVGSVKGPGSMFLDERLAHGPSRELLAARRWSAVVLQAQKYSSSGQFEYSTAEAAQWVRLAREGGAIPVLFPEWSRRGVPETARILALHESIAAQAPACIAPIPQAWDIALATDPALALHASDGNHANAAGSLLAALVIASTITGDSPAAFGEIASATVDGPTQARLRAAAAQAVAAHPPRRLCPADPIP